MTFAVATNYLQISPSSQHSQFLSMWQYYTCTHTSLGTFREPSVTYTPCLPPFYH